MEEIQHGPISCSFDERETCQVYELIYVCTGKHLLYAELYTHVLRAVCQKNACYLDLRAVDKNF